MWRHIPTLFGGRSVVPDDPFVQPPTASRDEDDVPRLPASVPDLVGLPSRDARRLAQAAQLAVCLEERPSSQGLWGRVLAQDPEPGTLLAPDGIVIVTVGARSRVPVPDLLGVAEDEALWMLREAGLGAARRRTRRSAEVPEGRVVRTRPRAGAEVVTGSRISYVVAIGPQETGRDTYQRRRSKPRFARLADGSFRFPDEHSDRRR